MATDRWVASPDLYEETNGFKHCVVRCGRRVLIDESKFFEWASKPS